MKYLFCAALFLFAACHKSLLPDRLKEKHDLFVSQCAEIDGDNYLHMTQVSLSYDRTICDAVARRDDEFCSNEADFREASEKACALLGTHFDCRIESYFNEGDNLTITYECYAESSWE